MRLPRDLSGRDLAKALNKLGYQITRPTGSHMRLTTDRKGEHHITIPDHDPLRVGTLGAIVGESGAPPRNRPRRARAHTFWKPNMRMEDTAATTVHPPRGHADAEQRGKFPLLAASFAILLCLAQPVPSASAEPPSLLVLNLELVDSSGEVTDQRADHERRLAAVRQILASELAARDVYDVVDPGEIQAEIDATRGRQYLHACNGCEIRLAREVDADRVLTGHVRKVSSLVMALWVDIRDADSGRPIVRKVLDFRGDNDRAWQRAALYLARALEQLPPAAR
jgi:predicted RNA binding protein YcfA (HicA-like mRNA interferase family)